ncbi:PspA/IM30 family protein [Neorhizobium sp. JUb45]|uniref:PspA/IM30 family protein n=1 Tax=unclassified Neorhizobium TaxID=2629175 RepID=UPI001051470F|nr:PspA/IM30 family protein [Neorhizobium sp. JUb45]TCQ98272.1 phage shock protein A (PspA) family protein [Neorhizobium sp. JUb45]
MFNLIATLLRGKAHDAEQAVADRHAMPLLAQQIREAAQAIQSAQYALAVAIAQNEKERSQHAVILSRIVDLEERTLTALSKGNDHLAREAADAIAFLEAERTASEQAQAQFSAAIANLEATVRAAEGRLKELQRGERLARATDAAQKIDHAASGVSLATLDDAERTLERLRDRQKQTDTVSAVLRQMEGPSRTAGLIERLAEAGCGAPLRSSADDVLARLRTRLEATA